MHIRNIIWDFDGTIMDSYPAIVTTTLNVAKQNRVNLEYDEIKKMVKVALSDALNYIGEKSGKSHADLFAEYLTEYANFDVKSLTLFPHVEDVLRLIIEQGGKNYIISHRGESSLQEHLEQHGIANLFAYSIGGDSGFPRKPNPASFIYLKERFQLTPQDTIVVGDRLLDVKAGYGAGFRGILYNNDSDFAGKLTLMKDYTKLLEMVRKTS